MSRPLRIEFRDAWYHVMNRGRRGEPVFIERSDYLSFLDVLKETQELWQLRIAAYCLMPNHYHLLMQTPRGNISRCMRHIDGVYTQRFNRRHATDGPLFRGRYKALLIDADTYLLQLVRYIHRNPVRAGLAANLKGYPWSSHWGYVSDHDKWTWLYKDFVLRVFSEDSAEAGRAYRRFVGVEDDAGLLKMFDQERWPVTLGSEAFVERLKRRFARKRVSSETPQLRDLMPDMDHIVRTVTDYYGVEVDDLCRSRRSWFNEPRNVAVYLSRLLRGDGLRQIGDYFGINHYSSVSSVVERLKSRAARDAGLRKRVDQLVSLVTKSQEQT